MTRSSPRVSVGLPVWNGENYLAFAVESLLAQDFEDFEIIISDNASTDRTPEICADLQARDPRIRYYRFDENQGASRNYNFTFEQARGEFFKWAAHDDACRPGFLGRCVRAFDESPDSVVLTYPRSVLIDGDGREIGPDIDHLETRHAQPHRRLAVVLRRMKLASPIFGLIRSDALRRTRLIDNFSSSDYVLFAELAMLGEFVEVPEELFLRRIHPDSSREVNLSRADVLAWFDPEAKAPRLVSEYQQVFFEYFRSVRRAPLRGHQRLLCYATIPRVVWTRRLRVVGGRWKRRLLESVGLR